MNSTNTSSDVTKYGDKYHFYYNFANNTVVCITFYKGQTIRGAAKCNPDDNFNLDVGRRLAYLRCKQKFAKKKLKHSRKVYNESAIISAKAKNNFEKAREFMNDSEMQFENANNELIKFESELNNI